MRLSCVRTWYIHFFSAPLLLAAKTTISSQHTFPQNVAPWSDNCGVGLTISGRYYYPGVFQTRVRWHETVRRDEKETLSSDDKGGVWCWNSILYRAAGTIGDHWDEWYSFTAVSEAWYQRGRAWKATTIALTSTAYWSRPISRLSSPGSSNSGAC